MVYHILLLLCILEPPDYICHGRKATAGPGVRPPGIQSHKVQVGRRAAGRGGPAAPRGTRAAAPAGIARAVTTHRLRVETKS